MKGAEALLLSGVVLGGIYLVARPRSAPARALPPRRPLPPIPKPLPLPDAGAEPSRLEELLAEGTGSGGCVVEPGTFYQVQPTDRLPQVAELALKCAMGQMGVVSQAAIAEYIYCMSSSQWNLDRYGSPSTSKSFPKEYLVPGINLGLRAAFLPRNAPAAQLMSEGMLPPRTVHAKTAKGLTADTSYGLLWLPPVYGQDLQQGIVTCAPYSWQDGSSAINPDPELLLLLEAA